MTNEQTINPTFEDIAKDCEDLFEHWELLPDNVTEILNQFKQPDDLSIPQLDKIVSDLEAIGFTCEYDQSSTLYNLRRTGVKVTKISEFDKDALSNLEILIETHRVIAEMGDMLKAKLSPHNAYHAFKDFEEQNNALEVEFNTFDRPEVLHALVDVADNYGLEILIKGTSVRAVQPLTIFEHRDMLLTSYGVNL